MKIEKILLNTEYDALISEYRIKLLELKTKQNELKEISRSLYEIKKELEPGIKPFSIIKNIIKKIKQIINFFLKILKRNDINGKL